ncbi:uncharacterized protein LOC132681968 isoform X2 [Panthera onca]
MQISCGDSPGAFRYKSRNTLGPTLENFHEDIRAETHAAAALKSCLKRKGPPLAGSDIGRWCHWSPPSNEPGSST